MFDYSYENLNRISKTEKGKQFIEKAKKQLVKRNKLK